MVRKQLNALLRPHNLGNKRNEYIAEIIYSDHVDMDFVIRSLVKDRVGLSEESIRLAVASYNRKVTELVCSGYSVNTGIVHIRPVARGVFRDKKWNSERHSIHAAVKPVSALRNALAGFKAELFYKRPNAMRIYIITDLHTGKTDGTLGCGNNIRLQGRYIKIVGAYPDCGIVLQNTQSKEAITLETNRIVINMPSELLLHLPSDIPVGTYTLTIRTRYTQGADPLNEPRSLTFATPLAIQ